MKVITYVYNTAISEKLIVTVNSMTCCATDSTAVSPVKIQMCVICVVVSMVITTIIMMVNITNITMMWISFAEGHVEVITDKQWQRYIIETSHAGVQGEELEDTAKHIGGHRGINKMQDKVSSRFFWLGIKLDV